MIKKQALDEALAGAASAYPNEFICLLIGRRDKGNIMIEETLIPPGIMVAETMSSFSEWMLPVIVGMMGTFHSHPNGSSLPSAADRRLFSQKGGVNLIAGHPYSEKNVSAYLGNGKRAEFRIVG
ncbi:TPA: metalloprotease [Candidatus Micrarchaeota archaeon]|nr:metalloprotease [Candidatus Micrarchaeota archaeon]